MPSAETSPSRSPEPARPGVALSADLLSILRCPVTGSSLRQEGDQLISTSDDSVRYAIEGGVPKLLAPR